LAAPPIIKDKISILDRSRKTRQKNGVAAGSLSTPDLAVDKSPATATADVGWMRCILNMSVKRNTVTGPNGGVLIENPSGASLS